MTDNEIDFNSPFMNEEEIEKTLDDIILSIGQEIVEEENRTAIINPIRMKEIAIVYKALQYLCKDTNTKISYTLHEPFQGVGSITITGKNIVFNNPQLFVKSCRLASNVDIYPCTDGTVRFDLTFYGLTKPIE